MDLSLAPLELYEVIFIAKRLDLNFVILDLNLSGCSVDAEGGAFLAQAIGKHKSLQGVRLDNNLLADDGARSLGRQLRDNVSIKRLDVSYNAMSDTGLAALLFGLLMGPPPPKPKEKMALAKLKTATALIRQNAALELGNHSPNSSAPKEGTAESPMAKDTSAPDVGKESKAGDEAAKEASGEAKPAEVGKIADDSKEAPKDQLAIAESSETVGNSSGDDDEEATLATEEKEEDDEEEEEEEEEDDGPVMLDEEAAAAAGLGPAVRKVVTKDQTTVDLMALVGPPPLQELDLSGNVLGACSQALEHFSYYSLRLSSFPPCVLLLQYNNR